MASEALFKKGLPLQEGAFKLKVSKDRLLAVVVAGEEDVAVDLDREELQQLLAAEGIVYGVLPEPAVRSDGALCVARGLAPQQGEDARVKMLVRASMVRAPKVKDPQRDKVDFRELGSIVNVRKGQQLLEIVPPTAGTPGKNVFGEEVPPKPGKDRKLKLGSGVVASDDERRVFAEVDGKFVMVDGKPAVYDEHVIAGDLDMSVGNIAFGGKKLIIQGEVPAGFIIKCRGDVVIAKGVHNSQVMAGGNLRVEGSVLGDETVLRAQGEVDISFMENGPCVEAGGKLLVHESAIQCQGLVGGPFDVRGDGDGVVVGGKYIIGGSVYVGDLGTDAEVQTTIHVGVVPSLQNRKQQVDDELRLWAERLNEIIKNISTLEKMQKEQGKNFPEKRAAMLSKYKTAMPKAMERVNELTEQAKEMERELEQMVTESVFVYGTIYPGAVINIGSATRFVTTEERECVVYFDRETRQILLRKMNKEEAATAGGELPARAA
ncbi:MAG: FapA family protein [Desulfurivibrio sp.]|nr:FapA family protein [Desulfurivibrio sp.]